jgi:hypothetical protein
MRLAKKRHWIALLAGLFLFGNVAGAVRMCVRDGFQASHSPAAAGHAMDASGGHAAQGDDECCDMQAGSAGEPPADCCAVLAAEHRNMIQQDPIVGAAFGFIAIVPRALPGAERKPAEPPPMRVLGFVGPPPSIVFKNFRV